jgi:sugar/nucleoside kinase (ribokinase family)
MLSKNLPDLLLKQGSKGSTLISNKNGVIERDHQAALNFEDHPSYKLVDTTGAGDTFTGAYAISGDQRFASAAAFLTISKFGAA